MRATWLSLLSIIFLSACGGAGPPREVFLPKFPDNDMTATITILSTNDFHGRYYPFPAGPADATSQTSDPGAETPYEFDRADMVGGFAYLAAAVNGLRQERGGENVLLVHTGDTFSDDLLGNLTQGEAIISLMNALGYDFMALGNHDFDYGVDRTRELAGMADFPMRGANVLEADRRGPFLGEPFVIRQVGGVKIALLALGYHNTEWTTSPKNIRGIQFVDGIEAARRTIPELRNNVDVVVVVSHQGAKIDEKLAREVEGIDLIIGGHSHDMIEPARAIGTCRISQALSDGAVLGETVIRVEKGKVAGIEGRNHILWNEGAAPDERMEALIREIRAPYRNQLEEILTVAEEPVPRQYKSESPFDVWVGERLMEETGSEIAMLPGIGYGISIQAGPVSRELLYTLLPHESKLVTMKLTGDQIREILEQSAANQKPDDPMDAVGGLIQTAGMRWNLDLSRPLGERVRDIRVGDRSLQPDRRYSVATHSGMLAGIHRYETFKRGEDIQRTERKINELIERKLQSVKKLETPEKGKFVIRGTEGA